MFNPQEGIQKAPYNLFKYWFLRQRKDMFLVIDKSSKEPVACIYDPEDERSTVVPYKSHTGEDASDVSTLPNTVEIEQDFQNFSRHRPEYRVGLSVDPENKPIEWAKDTYKTLIIGVALIRARESGAEDPDVAFQKVKPCLGWLESNGFYYGPSSTQYHESFEGGNLYHHLKTIDMAIQLMELPKFDGKVKLSSVVLTAAAHDWCKNNAYEEYTKKLPDAAGNWVPTKCWKYKDVVLPLGHGVSSLVLARQFFKLTTEEMLAIRWHMGAWRVVDSEMNELQQANENYPLVHLIQFADQLAIVNY